MAAVLLLFSLKFITSSHRVAALIQVPFKTRKGTLLPHLTAHLKHAHAYAQVCGPRVLEFLLRIHGVTLQDKGEKIQEIPWALWDLLGDSSLYLELMPRPHHLGTSDAFKHLYYFI